MSEKEKPSHSTKKCPYCDFNSYGTQGDFPEDKYLSCILDEIELYRDLISKNSVNLNFRENRASIIVAIRILARTKIARKKKNKEHL